MSPWLIQPSNLSINVDEYPSSAEAQSATKATTSSPQPDTWPPLSLDIASADIHEPMSSAIAEWALKQRTAFPSPIDFQKHLRALSDDKLYEELRAIDPPEPSLT